MGSVDVSASRSLQQLCRAPDGEERLVLPLEDLRPLRRVEGVGERGEE